MKAASFAFLLIILLGTLPLHAADPGGPFKILTYNVLFGFNHGKARALGVEWIKEQKADVVALQEMNGHTRETLATLALEWGHEHSVLLKEKGFPVALTANSHIELIEKRLKDMWHGYLHCKVRGTHIFVVHLSPSKHNVRVREAGILSSKIKPLVETGERVLVLGDFNCNSPLDREWLEKQSSTGEWRGRNKENADPGYVTMGTFLDLELTDLVHRKHGARDVQLGTFPTKINKQARPGRHWRIDFILASPPLVKRCTSAATLRPEVAHRISDHFPVQASFR